MPAFYTVTITTDDETKETVTTYNDDTLFDYSFQSIRPSENGYW